MSFLTALKRTSWWAVLLVLLGVGIGISAGMWQLRRAGEKQLLQERFDSGRHALPQRRLPSDQEARVERYRRLSLSGRYDSEHQVLLDNLSLEGRPGYQVLTPLVGPQGTVLVNRGFLPDSGNRNELPDLAVDEDTRQVSGLIDQLPRPGLRLTAPLPPTTAPWPRRLLFPTATELRAQLGTEVREFQVLLDPDATDGFVREWKLGGMGAARHLAYAVQWFGLALTVVVIYVVLVLKNAKQAT